MVKRWSWVPVLLLAALSGCEIANVIIPRADAMIVVHAILDPSNSIQYILVEQSLTGATTVIGEGRYDPNNPIVSGNGVPVSGAVVTITDPNGRVLPATQQLVNGRPTGVYRIFLPLNYVLQPGGQYSLSVTAMGTTVTGTTVIPNAVSSGIRGGQLNRDHDSVDIVIRGATLTRAYWVRTDAPIAAYSIFTLDSATTIAGDSRNLFTADLVHLFYPGFLQTVTVAAVDTNVYDYYRSGNDPFSGKGLINHLTGGLGVFGSMVVVEQRLLDVTQDPTGDPIEGHYTVRTGPFDVSSAATDITLFLEARGDNGVDQLSGSHLRGLTSLTQTRAAVYGTRTGANIDLRLLFDENTNDINYEFTGVARGDSLIGNFGGAQVVYVRAGK